MEKTETGRLELEREIRAFRNGLDESIRQRHPKGVRRRDWHRLCGMIAAWLYVTGRWDHPGSVLMAGDGDGHLVYAGAVEGEVYQLVLDHLGIDLVNLYKRVEA